MKLSKIAALFMVPVLALCLVACSAPGGNASESASSDPKIAELTAQKPANADEAAELYAKLMKKEKSLKFSPQKTIKQLIRSLRWVIQKMTESTNK